MTSRGHQQLLLGLLALTLASVAAAHLIKVDPDTQIWEFKQDTESRPARRPPHRKPPAKRPSRTPPPPQPPPPPPPPSPTPPPAPSPISPPSPPPPSPPPPSPSPHPPSPQPHPPSPRPHPPSPRPRSPGPPSPKPPGPTPPLPPAIPPPPLPLPEELDLTFSLEWSFSGDVDIVVMAPAPATDTITFLTEGCYTCEPSGYGMMTTVKTNSRAGPESVNFKTPPLGTYYVCATYTRTANITGRVSVPARGIDERYSVTLTRNRAWERCDPTAPGYVFSYELK